MTSSEPDLRRRAADLVLHYGKTLAQAARILGCGIPTVQQFVQEHLDRHPPVPAPSAPAEVEPSFVPVLLDDESASAPSTIPLDILTPNGLTLRLQLSSLHEVATLLHSLEGDRC